MSHRIVSLLPAATEIVYALGAEAALVGRSHECDYPPSAEWLPICSSPRIDVSGSSREIDERVKQQLHDGLSIFQVDEKLLARLEPTLVLTQAQCEVCAVSLQDVEAALGSRIGSRPQVLSLSPNSLADVWADLRRVAAVLAVAAQGDELVNRLIARLASIRESVRRSTVRRSRVACIEWLEPPMAAGNWVPELVEVAGGENLFGLAGQHSPWLSWDAVVAADPELLVVMPCGFGLPRSRSELHWLTSRPDWPNLRAVRDGRVALADGHHYFNRPGPRLVESAEILAEILHPDLCDFGHRGEGWEPL